MTRRRRRNGGGGGANGSGDGWTQDRQRRRAWQVSAAVQGLFVDVEQLQKVAFQRGGFLHRPLRKAAWSRLVGVNPAAKAKIPNSVDNKYSKQIKLDIDRSLWQYESDQERRVMRRRLSRIINALMVKYPDLHYYQGFHDVVSVPLIELDDDDTTFNIMCRLCRCHLKAFMGTDLSTVTPVMHLTLMVIKQHDRPLFHFLSRAQIGGEFTISWVVTWFSHVLQNHRDRCRVFDACLASHPHFVVYIAAAVVLSQSEQLQALECDFASVYQHLTRIRALNWERVVVEARRLQRATSPAHLLRMCDRSDFQQILRASDIEARYRALVAAARRRNTDTIDQFDDFATIDRRESLIQLAALTSALTLAVAVWAAVLFLPRSTQLPFHL